MVRCEVACWYVLSWHAEQMRFAVLESALIFWPLPQTGCEPGHDVSRCEADVW